MDLEQELTQILTEIAFGVKSYAQDHTKALITTKENNELSITISERGYLILNETFESLESLLMAKSELFAYNFNQQVCNKLQDFMVKLE
jgi:hypothetical protein